MDDSWWSGTWLLIDAAGPVSVTGLVRDGEWLGMEENNGDFLEWFAGGVENLLQQHALQLKDLQGVIYASGPGSTLGLRLAAMFVRSWMELPLLKHWKCLQYQNLELALNEFGIVELVAPWKRDHLHHSTMILNEPDNFIHGSMTPQAAVEKDIPGVTLGRRPANISESIDWRPYPIKQIPRILKSCPALLHEASAPLPYTAEDPKFARWSSKRHSAS